MEQWKDIQGYEGYYEISDKGRIKSLKRQCKTSTGHRTVPEKILSFRKSSNGYLTIGLAKNNIDKTYQAHKLVYLHFIKNNIPEGMQINHIDGNKENNDATNLELTTPSENRKHAFRIGIQKKPFGERNSMAKLSDSDLISLRAMIFSGKKDSEIAEYFSLSKKYVNDIRNGRSRKAIN